MNIDKITKYLDSLIERGIPSVDCLIMENHKLVYRHSAGSVDEKNTPVSDDTMYLMFSMTKVQTMACVLQLVEQGKLSLEDEVKKYLPAYGKLTVEGENGVEPLKTPLLVKHLLSMQSGLDYDLGRPGILRIKEKYGENATTRQIVDAFAESPLKFVPGTHYLYSLSHDVAAALVEVVSGMTFGEYLKKNIWEPLHMTRTFFARPMNDHIKNLADQYECNEKGEPHKMELSCCYQLSSKYESGGAGLVSCTKDYAVFADTMACGGISADGVRILKPETVELMKENLLGETSMEEIARNMGRVGYGYGCGVQVLLQPELLNSPAPKGVFGWDGAAGSCIIMDTASKRSLVYMQHVRNCGMAYGEIHPRLRDMMFE